MEPPAKRTKTGLHDRQDDEANDEELSLTPSQLSARQDPLYELDKGRAKAASKLKSRFESIFEKYAQDFDGVGDEINLHTGEVAIDNGHLQSLEDDKDKEGDEEEQEEERILQPKRQPSQALSLARSPPPPALTPAHNAAVAFLQQNGWTPPPGFNADLSALSSLPPTPQLFGTPNPLGFANSLLGPGPAPADPLWQTPELETASPQSHLGLFGTGHAPQHGQRPALSQLFAQHAQRKTTSARNLNLKRKKLLEGTLAEGDENSRQDGKTGNSVDKAGDDDSEDDDVLLGVSQEKRRPAPLPKTKAKGAAVSAAAESSGSAKVEHDPLFPPNKTQRLPKGLEKHVKTNGKQMGVEQPVETTGTTGKRKKPATVPLTLPASENADESRDTAASETTEPPARRKRGRPAKPKQLVATRVQTIQPDERNNDASYLTDRPALKEPEPEPVADVLPEIHPEILDEEALNAQLMEAVNEALVLVTSPMKSWPGADLEELATQRDRPPDPANTLFPEHQGMSMSSHAVPEVLDAMTPNPKAIPDGPRSAELPAPAGISTEADKPAPTSHLKEVWTRNRTDPSFAFSDDEDEDDFQQSWGPPGNNNSDLCKDASADGPALAAAVAGAADPVEDRAAVTVPETRLHEPGLEEPPYLDTVQAPPTEDGSEIAKSSSVATLEINHSPFPNAEAEDESLEASNDTNGIPTAADSPEGVARENEIGRTPPAKRRGRPFKGRVPKARAAESKSLEASVNSHSIPTAADIPEGEIRENETTRTPPPKRRGRPSRKGRVPKARAAESKSLEASAYAHSRPTAADTPEGEIRENETARTPPAKRRGRPSHKGRVPKAQSAEPESLSADIADSPKDRGAEPKSPPADISASPRIRVTEQSEAPPIAPSASSGARDRRGTPGFRRDRFAGSGKNQTPTGERRPNRTSLQEAAQAEPAKKLSAARAKRRRSTLTSLVPDLSDDDVDEISIVSSHDTPTSSSFASSLSRAAAHTAHPRLKAPLHATGRRHSLLLGSSLPRPSPASAASVAALSSAPRSKLADSRTTAHSSPLLERVLKTTPRKGGRDQDKGKAASGDAIRTPGGTVRRCGVDGFVCERDFCFACCN